MNEDIYPDLHWESTDEVADFGPEFWQQDLGEDYMDPWEAEGEVYLAQFD